MLNEVYPKNWNIIFGGTFFMSKLSDEDKANIVAHYLNSGDGFKLTAREFGVDKSTVRLLVLKYNEDGANALIKKSRSYDTQFKIHVLEYQRKYNLSDVKTCTLFKISTTSLLRNWRKKYCEGGYCLLDSDKRGDPKTMTKKQKEKQITEKSELEKLREENEYLRMENAILKKLRALIREEEKSGQNSRQESSEN